MDNNSSVNTGPDEPEICIESLKRGDKKAFALFVNTYQDMVFACCRTAGLGPEDIEDAASETFLAAYKSIHRFKGQSKLSSWLWTIAYRKALDIQRKNGSQVSFNEDILTTTAASQNTTTEDALDTRESSDAIWAAVQQLPQNWAAAVVLFYREDKTIKEIAQILNIPDNTVKTYLDRGRKKLYNSLETYWKDNHVKL